MFIGELSKRTGVSRRSIRYYEKCGLLQAGRSGAGWREYDESAVTRILNVRDLLAVGLRVRDIHRLSPACLQQDIKQTPACDETIEMYAMRIAEIDASIATLRRHRESLAARLEDLLERRHADRDDQRRTSRLQARYHAGGSNGDRNNGRRPAEVGP